MPVERCAGRSWLCGALGALLIFTAACAGGGSAGGDEAGIDFGSLSKGSDAPEFSLQAVGGDEIRLSDSDGMVRLIDFWATWCVPCREEIPMFKELYDTYGSQGFTILAISDESSGVIHDFVETHEIDYPNLIDPGEVSENYEVLALPSAFLIDREGNIVETFVGPKPRKVLEAAIVELLEAAPAT